MSESLTVKDYAPGEIQGRSPSTGPVVSRFADGIWLRLPSQGYHTPSAYSFWIDLEVQNLDSSKTVGILWTNDHWNTTRTAYASYDGVLANGLENWGIDIDLTRGESTQIEYAAFSDQLGVRHWDPHNNHFLGYLSGYNVKYLGGQVVSTGSGLYFEGLVRVKNIAYEKVVSVTYTKNNWSSSAVVNAVYSSGNDWLFHIPLSLPNPFELEFAVSYTVAGSTYWDNNEGSNYKAQVGPKVELLSHQLGDVLSGVELVRGQDLGINPLTTLTVTVAGANQVIDGSTFFRFLLQTSSYYPSASVTIGVHAVDDKGFTLDRSFSFDLDHTLINTGSFGFDEFEWPYSLKVKDGYLYGTDYGTGTFFRRDILRGGISYFTGSAGRDIDALSDGTMVTLGGQSLFFYTPEGALIKTITLDPSFLHIPVQLEIHNDELWVGSYVNSKVVRLNKDTGALLGTLPLNSYQTFRITDNKFHVLTNFPSKVLTVSDLNGQNTVEIDLENQGYDYLRDFAVNNGQIYFLGQNSMYVSDLAGQIVTQWNGWTLEDNTDLDGGFGSVITSVEAFEGQIFVGDFGNHKIHTFNFR